MGTAVTNFNAEREVQRLVASMADRFPGCRLTEIERVVRAAFARLADAKVPNFVSVLAEKTVVSELRVLQLSA